MNFHMKYDIENEVNALKEYSDAEQMSVDLSALYSQLLLPSATAVTNNKGSLL